MTKVDFYILASGSRERTACKLSEKAYSLGNRVYIHTETVKQTQQIDELLWTFRDGSFVPHEQYQADASDNCPILIGCAENPDTECDVLINLAGEVPLFFSRFLRVAELVGTDATTKAQGRDRFRFYRDRGYPLETHELNVT